MLPDLERASANEPIFWHGMAAANADRMFRCKRLSLVVAACALSLAACAGNHPVPTQAMAKAAVEIHLAEKEGARHTPDGAKLCAQAEQALEQSRKSVARGRNRESAELAEQGYNFARRARITAPSLTLATHSP